MKYEKYVDDDGVYHYELTLENGNKHWVQKELGDYLHSLESQLKEREEDCELKLNTQHDYLKATIADLRSQLKERDEILDDVLNYIQDSDDYGLIVIKNRISNLKYKKQ